jgi:hypothetical protein
MQVSALLRLTPLWRRCCSRARTADRSAQHDASHGDIKIEIDTRFGG